MPIEYVVRRGSMMPKVYKGMTLYKLGQIPDGCSLVIANFEGDLELWVVEGKTGLKALREYYQDEWGVDRSIPFQEFNCTSVEKNMKADKWFL